jgi:hypothetical protein
MVSIQGIVSERFRTMFTDLDADGLTRADEPKQ